MEMASSPPVTCSHCSAGGAGIRVDRRISMATVLSLRRIYCSYWARGVRAAKIQTLHLPLTANILRGSFARRYARRLNAQILPDSGARDQ